MSSPVRRPVLEPPTDDPFQDRDGIAYRPIANRTATPPSRQPDHQFVDVSAEEETEDEDILVPRVAHQSHDERVQVTRSPDALHK